jgi:hypothetical protein
MEAQDNLLLAVRKAISAHEEAANTIADLTSDPADTTYAPLLDRIKQNLSELHALAERGEPSDTV